MCILLDYVQVRESIDYYGFVTQTEAKGTSSSKRQGKMARFDDMCSFFHECQFWLSLEALFWR